MQKIKTDVCILGAGAGGTGAAYRLLRQGFRVVICDKNPDFGGTAVYSGVSCWEPGISLSGLHERLRDVVAENGAYVGRTVPNCNLFYPENGDNWENDSFALYPWGLSVKDENGVYADTLQRCASHNDRKIMRRFQFDGADMTAAMNRVLSPYKENLTTLFSRKFASVRAENDSVKAIVLDDGTEIEAEYFIDASATLALARAAGCEVSPESEGPDAYGEPSAVAGSLNGVTFVFRVKKHEDAGHIDEIPEEYDVGDAFGKGVISCFNIYPNGDINVNMLPTLDGMEFRRLKDRADFEGKRRVYRYWRYLQENHGMKGYTLTEIFQPGVREDYRLVGRCVLTENDIRDGIYGQKNRDRFIAVADHLMDIHGSGGLAKTLSVPYGIPIECCMAKEYENLFVACRAASFSHIAASSARLTRTMMSMGEGVGEYLAVLMKTGEEDMKAVQAAFNYDEIYSKEYK